MKIPDHLRTDRATIRARILAGLAAKPRERLTSTASCADLAWPGHNLRRQGAAFAVGSFLRDLCNDGLICWEAHEQPYRTWGYRITGAGRAMVDPL